MHVAGMKPAARDGQHLKRAPLMTTEELASYPQLSPRTVEDWRLHGVGPSYVRIGKRIRYRPEAIEEWLVKEESRSTESSR